MSMVHIDSHNCVFCSPYYREKSGRACDTILHQDSGFFTVPTLGSIVPGWLLVVSKEHHICAGALNDEKIERLADSVACAQRSISKAFAEATVFEHGPHISKTPVGCGIDHLHMHVAPLPASLTETCAQLYGTVWQSISSIADLRHLHEQGVPYIFVKEPSGTCWWAMPPVGIRQPLRRAIAHMVGLPEQFDYRIDSFEENISETLRVLSSAA